MSHHQYQQRFAQPRGFSLAPLTPPALLYFPGEETQGGLTVFAMSLNKSPAQFRDTAEVKFKLTPTVACRTTKPWVWLSDNVDSKGHLFAGF